MSIFNLPDLGEGLPDAEIHQWQVKIGDSVKTDQPMVAMETAKAVVDVPAPQDGIIKKFYGQPGDIIKTGAPLVEFESLQSKENTSDSGTVVGNIETSEQVIDETASVGASTNSGQPTKIKVTPAVRALARKLNVDLSLVTSSRPDGLITADDVKQFSEALNAAGELELLKGSRRMMAFSMSKAHAEVAAVTLQDDAELELDSSKTKQMTVAIIQAIASAVKVEPALNAWYDNQAVGRRLHQELHLGLAIDSSKGLYVPVITHADSKSAEELRERINLFREQSQANALSPSDLKGATFTLSNFGALSGKYANPIVVPPTVAILGVGKMHTVPAVHKQEIVIRQRVPLSLTIDHRAVTGGEAARFLKAIKIFLES